MSRSGAYVEAAIEAIRGMADTQELDRVCEAVSDSLRSGGKILICGNGGSAADAQHIAGELVCRFRRNRRALAAVALSADSAVITAIANDYDYSEVFSRQVEALGRQGDVLLAISTSGESSNVLKAASAARKAGMTVVAFTALDGGRLGELADIGFHATSPVTSHAQEVLLVAAHALCDAVEANLSEHGETPSLR